MKFKDNQVTLFCFILYSIGFSEYNGDVWGRIESGYQFLSHYFGGDDYNDHIKDNFNRAEWNEIRKLFK